jgi:hypothetical protein
MFAKTKQNSKLTNFCLLGLQKIVIFQISSQQIKNKNNGVKKGWVAE